MALSVGFINMHFQFPAYFHVRSVIADPERPSGGCDCTNFIEQK